VSARQLSFGTALRRARLKKKLTQQALAERIGVSDATYISKWERNIIVPSLLYQQKLREALGDFFGGGGGIEAPKGKTITWKIVFPIQIVQLDDPSPEENE